MKFSLKDLPTILNALKKHEGGRIMLECAFAAAVFTPNPVKSFQSSLAHNGFIVDGPLSQKLFEITRAAIAAAQKNAK